MPSLSAIKANISECDVEIHGVKVHLKFKPGEYTPEAVSEFRNASMVDGIRIAFEKTLKAFVQRLVVEWDVTEDEAGKKPLPITEEGLNKVPIEWLDEMITQINKAMSGEKKANS